MSDLPALMTLPETLLSKDGEVDTFSVLENDLIGLYFSAHWCPPCKQFTPFLADAYKDWKADGKKIAIIFVSMDKDIDEFKSYFSEMPWYAIHYNQIESKQYLSQFYKVQGIPNLTVLSKESKLIDDNGRMTVTNNPGGCVETWLKKV